MLLTLINEQLWCGHFDMWSDDGMLIFRHGQLLHGGAEMTLEQAHALFELPIDAAERYYPAFQFVLWGDKSAADAMTSAMLDNHGRSLAARAVASSPAPGLPAKFSPSFRAGRVGVGVDAKYPKHPYPARFAWRGPRHALQRGGGEHVGAVDGI